MNSTNTKSLTIGREILKSNKYLNLNYFEYEFNKY
jgi:hypothetical protein